MQGFPDPTKTPHARKALKGIATLHPVTQKRAKPLSHLRNRALVLLGFWRGFRSDELSRLCVEQVTIEPGRGIDRWGRLSNEGLHAGSFVPLLRALFRAAGVPAPESYSSHSLRRGFANWANSNGWDVKMLMEYVGWKDVRSAMRYVDAADPFAQHRIESALAVTPLASPSSAPAATALVSKTAAPTVTAPASSKAATRLTLQLVIERNSKFVRGMTKARRWIEDFCLPEYAMRCLNRQRTRYELVMPFVHGPELEAAIEDLLGEIHSTADLCNCMAEAVLHDSVTDTYWH
jgi:hypothetical protein